MSNSDEIECMKVCRTCLTTSEDMQSLYQDCSTSKQICLAEMLMSFTPLKYDSNDGLPKQICHNCIGELNRFYTFQLKCLESDAILRDHAEISDNSNMQRKHELSVPREERGQCTDTTVAKLCTIEMSIESDRSSLRQIRSAKRNAIIMHKQQQQQQHVDTKPYSCHFCEHTFKKKSNLTVHLRTHTGEKPYSCPNCDSAFKQKGHLAAHQQKHLGEAPYLCALCDTSFPQKNLLARHMRKHTSYSCIFCDKTFVRKETLKRHLLSHSGDNPYSCTLCDSSFNRKDLLLAHMQMHLGQKPYSCTLCENAFNRKGHLTRHLQTHTGEKPYACTLCDTSFNRKENLKVHLRSHAKGKR